jgi:hypothetical protein
MIGVGYIIQLWAILLPLGSLQRSSTILKRQMSIAEDFCNTTLLQQPSTLKALLSLPTYSKGFFFVEFRKSFDTVPRKNLWNRLEEIKVSFELRVATIRLH